MTLKHIKINLGIFKIEILKDPEKELEILERRLLLEIARAKEWERARVEKMSVIEAKFQKRINEKKG